MPVSGLVLTFRSPVAEHADDIRMIESIPEVDLGEAGEFKLAIVIDSETSQRDREIWDTIKRLPGITDISVAMIGFDDEPCDPD